MPGFLFYMAGNTVWTFFANCVNNTANTFVTNSQIFGKVYFPRLTMPVSQVLTSLINFGIQAVMYLIFWVYFFATGSGVTFTLWVLAVPFVVLEVMLLGLGVGIIVSSLTTKYRDLAIAVASACSSGCTPPPSSIRCRCWTTPRACGCSFSLTL